MKIEKVIVGNLEENCYILDIYGKVIIVDPGDEFDKINEKVNNREILAILITHSHFDHVGALASFKDIDKYYFNNLKEKQYNIDNFTFEVIFTPGHSSDSVSYYFSKENVLFSGDFIFYNDIGRCDLPTGSMIEMKKSIKKIKKMPLDTIIYPGHGKKTNLKFEIENNYYFKD